MIYGDGRLVSWAPWTGSVTGETTCRGVLVLNRRGNQAANTTVSPTEGAHARTSSDKTTVDRSPLEQSPLEETS